ncbi:hypothetical protein NM208_g8729 [Fusarium decemcellulare]|uniref:Uncharacterized protein n=1 Tax=Fusarium decemcellulare TaxID=57161 RepID=A0ACC1S4G3_9HYPO|nr:hypothetical protein NM208_g8729 [Fusarium decemcellulare]
MSPVDPDRFYSSLLELGYEYSASFRTMSSMQRRLNYASALIESYSYTDTALSSYLIHPSTLDTSFQLAMLAHSAPGDGQLWSLHVPTSIQSIRVSPGMCALMQRSGTFVPARARVDGTLGPFSASIDLLNADTGSIMVQVEDLVIKPFAPATEADDRIMYTYTRFDLAGPDGSCIVEGARPSTEEVEAARACERISYYYQRKWKSEITEAEWASGPPHHLLIKDWIDHTTSQASSGQHPSLRKDWSKDSPEDIRELARKYWQYVDIRLVTSVGENMAAAVRGETTILEHMTSENMLDEYYEKGPGLSTYHHLLAAMAKQITHRYPHAKFIEIGAGTGGATKMVLDAVGSTISSYTYTDISRAFFERAVKSFAAHSDKLVFRTLDIEKEPATQSYEPHSYDVAIAFNVLHATRSLEATLANTRQLLKPGGYLMLLEFTNNDPIRFGTTMAGLPGWWLGINDGRKMAPTVSTGVWHSTLRKAGFGGVDTATPEIDGITWPISILVAQAVDDRVQFLRQPLSSRLSSKSSFAPIHIGSLIILGTGTLTSLRIAERAAEYLEPFCDEVTVLRGLPTQEEAVALSPLSTFINLVDLDTPIFKGMTPEKMGGLQRMFDLAKHVLWITQGAVSEQPYHMASVSFSRTVRREAKHISLNHLDISDPSHPETSRSIAEHLLRLYALDEWEADHGHHSNSQQLLWSKEPEAYLDRGKLRVPRLVVDVDQNARLNALRRPIAKMLQTSESSANAQVLWTQDDYLPSLVELTIPSRGIEAKLNSSLISVESSSIMALRVTLDTYLFLAAGKDDATGSRVISLSTVNSLKIVPIVSFYLPVEGASAIISTDVLIVATAGELIADSITQCVTRGARILVHCSSQDYALVSALGQSVSLKGVYLILACDEDTIEDLQRDQATTFGHLSTRMSQHDMQRTLQRAQPTHYIDLIAQGGQQRHHLGRSGLGSKVARGLPATCRIIEAATFFQRQSSLPESFDHHSLISQLEAAISRSLTTMASGLQLPPPGLVVPVDQVQVPAAHHHPTTAVRWLSKQPIEVDVRPLEACKLFSGNKTYLLAGLSGQIGQSLCEFMVANGAGVVCLTSRHPNIDERWLASLRRFGAEVKVLAMDVTDRKNVEAVVEYIRATCPPIAGVAHGAMVLSDALFSKMTTDQMTQVLGPKIDGAINLDEIFSGDDLDFFVLFSSVSCAMGNVGQSNYVAANGYLNGLARQRRRRGLPASIFDIGRVAGLGYIETVGQELLDQLLALGLQSISESDLRQAFAETILMGYVRSSDQDDVPHAVVTTGIRSFRDDEDVKGPWFTNPLFSHLVIESASSGSGAYSQGQQKSTKTALRVSEQISRATSMEEAADILKGCFSDKLRVILQSYDQDIDHDVPLVELGIDSLVAVEVRSWWLKELKVDVSVLKVIGGDSLTELCESTLEKLPKDLLVSIGKEKVELDQSTATTTPPYVQQDQAPQVQQRKDVDSGLGSSESGSDSIRVRSDTSPILSPAKPSSVSTTASLTTDMSPAAANGKPNTPDSTKSFATQNQATNPWTTAKQALEPSRKSVKRVPISFAQSRYWFLHHLLQDRKTSNVAFYYHVQGNLRIGDLARALRMVIARHESLRTCFVEDEADAAHAFQHILASSPIKLQCENITTVDQVAGRFAVLRKHEFDLASGELIQMVLLTLSPSSHYLLIHHHHLLMDGVSMRVFLADLEKAYNGQTLGGFHLQYPDFSVAQRQAVEKGEMTDQLQYWRDVFPAGEQVPVLPLLPMARIGSRVFMKRFDTHEVNCRLEPAVAAKIRVSAKKQQSTPFHVYLAAFQAMLYRFTDAQELIIGMADAARNTGELLNSIGFFLNLLPLRFRCQPDQPFNEAIVEARKTSHAALKTSRLPFDVLLEELGVARSASHSPLFQAFIDYRQGSPEKQRWGDCQLEMQEWHLGKTAYDITIDVTDTRADTVVMLRVQKSLYDVTAAELLLKTYVHLLDDFVSDPSLALSVPPLFSNKMLTCAAEVGRGPDMVSDWPATIPHRIDQVARMYPDRVALLDGIGASKTYASMLDRIEAIVEALRAANVARGAHVLVFQTAAVDWACSMLAIMRIGAIYIPLDLRNPIARLAAVAAETAPAAILADATTVGDVPQLEASRAQTIDISTVSMSPTSKTRTENLSRPDAPAAILYTSGSTGTPKGIVISHSGLRNELEGYTKEWKLGAERVLQQSTFTFDFATDQMFTALVNGGTVCFVPSSARGSPVEITELIQQHNITYTRATPSEYLLWLQYGAENLSRALEWRFAFAGGESVSSTLIQELARLRHPQMRLFNSYGPAETTHSKHPLRLLVA